MKIPSLKLRSGNQIPQLGLGTWMLTGDQCVKSVKKAIELGYNHIDTAQVYGNHKEVGKAISGTDRSELFITSKIWRSDLRYDDVFKACDRALKELGTEYLDLYLIHWPDKDIAMSETLSAMEELQNNGKIISTGVSNFTVLHLQEALSTGMKISVNQVEFHPLLYQKELLDFCKRKGILLTAYCPLARGNLLKNKTLSSIGKIYGKTSAQVSLCWLVQKGIVVIPKASSEKHVLENMEIFDWELSEEDEKTIDNIDVFKRVVDPPFSEFEPGIRPMRYLNVLKNIDPSGVKQFLKKR